MLPVPLIRATRHERGRAPLPLARSSEPPLVRARIVHSAAATPLPTAAGGFRRREHAARGGMAPATLDPAREGSATTQDVSRCAREAQLWQKEAQQLECEDVRARRGRGGVPEARRLEGV